MPRKTHTPEEIAAKLRQVELKVPPKQPRRSRLWLADGSCIRLRPEYPNHGWSYDFVEDRTHEGRKYRMLNVLDEFTRECLALRVNRKRNSVDVLDVLTDLFILRGIPGGHGGDKPGQWNVGAVPRAHLPQFKASQIKSFI